MNVDHFFAFLYLSLLYLNEAFDENEANLFFISQTAEASAQPKVIVVKGDIVTFTVSSKSKSIYLNICISYLLTKSIGSLK